MKNNVTLVVLSLLSALLVVLHIADDIARGLDSAGPQNMFGVLILGVWLCGALVLPGRRSGLIILLLGAIFGMGIVAIHMSGAGLGRIAKSDGGFFFIATLFALGSTAFVSLVLSLRGLWRLRRGQSVSAR